MLDINVPLLLIHAATFLAAMALIWFLFLKPLLEAMNRRQTTVRSDLDEARKAREEAEKLQAKLDKELRDSREKIRKELDKAASEGEETRRKLKEQATAEAEVVLEKARAEIKEEMAKAKKALRGESAALAVAIAEKLLEAEVDAAKHKKLIDQMIEKV